MYLMLINGTSEDARRRAIPKSHHPVILKVSPDEDYHWQANLAHRYGCAAITAISCQRNWSAFP